MRLLNKLFIITIFVAIGFVVFPAFGDGLAGETLPPSVIGNRNVTLSINSSPFLIDNTHVGTQVNFALLDADSQQPISGVTMSISASKADKSLFGHIFKSDNGNFLLNLTPQKGDITIDEVGGIISGITGAHSGDYDLKGSAFNESGLYKFKIEVLTMDSYDNQVSKLYNVAISIPETKQYLVHDNEDGDQNVTLIAYYDQITNFQYDSEKKTMTFSMPFDWSDSNVNQVSVVHQELKIPKSFGNFIVTKYDATVNGVKLNDRAISIDDYSSDERIVHLIIYKQDLFNILKQQTVSKPEMDFTLNPSNETAFPIIQFTNNAQYKVSLSWDPPKILPGKTTKFSFQLLDPYFVNKTLGSTDYDFSIIAGKSGSIFHSSGRTVKSGLTTIDVPIPADYTGPITIAFDNLNGSSFANTEFSGVISNMHTVPEFQTGLLVITAIFSLVIVTSKKTLQKLSF